MAISRETLRLAKELRVIVDGTVDTTVRQLVEAWARAWEQVEAEWTAAIADLIDNAPDDGQWPSRRYIIRAERAQRAMTITHAEVVQLAEFAGVTVVTAAREVTEETARWQELLIGSQLPEDDEQTATIIAGLARVDQHALGAIVERTTEQVTSLAKPLSDDAVEAMLEALVRGVAVGNNPRTAARRMLRRVEGRFNGGLSRALNIARTEILDAHRSGAAAAQLENEDVLTGWIWHAQLDTRTCPSCWAQHGRLYQLHEIGPIDHQQGRCARTPKTKSWRELGFDIDEPEDLLPDAREKFDNLSPAQQLEVMGAARLHALDHGAIAWADLSTLRSNNGWRDSYVPIRVGDVRRKMLTPL